jgi:hypothetical protein
VFSDDCASSAYIRSPATGRPFECLAWPGTPVVATTTGLTAIQLRITAPSSLGDCVLTTGQTRSMRYNIRYQISGTSSGAITTTLNATTSLVTTVIRTLSSAGIYDFTVQPDCGLPVAIIPNIATFTVTLAISAIPIAPTITSITPDSVALTTDVITAIALGDIADLYAVTGFRGTLSPGNIIVNAAPGIPLHFTTLSAGITYAVIVVALNSVGTSPSSVSQVFSLLPCNGRGERDAKNVCQCTTPYGGR